jgi:DNA mismatch repair protein MutS2
VALKTMGLLSLMAQAGLHIPVAEGSRLGIFSGIFADIGDEQSILHHLSSFAAHIRRLSQILEQADAHTLVLLDELATGTDPAEGVALGKAILENLLAREARTVITTHYWELKTFAQLHPQMRNASVEFDSATLQPTYKLRMGVPGRSNALAMAAREGLSPGIINQAREFLGNHRVKLEELVVHLEEDHREIEAEKRSVETRSREIKTREGELFKELNVLKQQRKSVKERASEEARAIVRDAQRRVEGLFKRLEKVSPDRKMLEEVRLTLKKESEKIAEELYPQSLPSEPVKDLKIGEKVRLSRWNQTGEVLSILPEQWALVRIGEVKAKVPFAELERLPEVEIKKSEIEEPQPDSNLTIPAVGDKLDIRGLRVEEAMTSVDKYLDSVYLSGLARVILVHGIGTGALRKAISEMLAVHPHVASFCPGEVSEGGAGVTVVSLK